MPVSFLKCLCFISVTSILLQETFSRRYEYVYDYRDEAHRIQAHKNKKEVQRAAKEVFQYLTRIVRLTPRTKHFAVLIEEIRDVFEDLKELVDMITETREFKHLYNKVTKNLLDIQKLVKCINKYFQEPEKMCLAHAKHPPPRSPSRPSFNYD